MLARTTAYRSGMMPPPCAYPGTTCHGRIVPRMGGSARSARTRMGRCTRSKLGAPPVKSACTWVVLAKIPLADPPCEHLGGGQDVIEAVMKNPWRGPHCVARSPASGRMAEFCHLQPSPSWCRSQCAGTVSVLYQSPYSFG